LLFEKLANAAEMSIADCALKHDRIEILEKQNNEKKVRQAARSTVVGQGKVFSWDDIVAARQKQDQKAVSKQSKRTKLVQKTKGKASDVESRRRKRLETDEIAEAEREISKTGMASFCSVFSVAV
jgi:hypothetical protein